MGKTMGRHLIRVTYSQKHKKDPKVGRDPVISALSCTPPLTGCQSPKLGQYDQKYPKTWSRANTPEVEPVISLNSLTSFSATQTLELIFFTKHRKVNILVDIASTHNFIHLHISQENNCYIYVANNFQIVIVNCGFMKCG
jgi:hypothetical protein